MRKYTITEYEMEDYNSYNPDIEEIISNLKHIKRGYIGDYNFTGEEDDYNLYKLHHSIYKTIEILKKYRQFEENKS